MAKGDKFYFENFAQSAALSREAAAYLVECLEHYNPACIEDMLKNMHEIENKADMKKHEMNDALAKAFVTPVDREDLDMLSKNMDQVTDNIEEVLQKLYIYNIQTVDATFVEFAKKIVQACQLLCTLMDEFENFKRSKNIKKLIIEINDVEEECDRLYLSDMRALTQKTDDVLAIIYWRDIYECLEACADACEHAAECIDAVIMKNT